MRTTRTAPPSGWLGHRGIPRPAVVRREHRSAPADGLDCLLAIWIAQAMLDGPSPRLPRRRLRQEPSGAAAKSPHSTGTP